MSDLCLQELEHPASHICISDLLDLLKDANKGIPATVSLKTKRRGLLIGVTQGKIAFRTSDISLLLTAGTLLYVRDSTEFNLSAFNNRTAGWSICLPGSDNAFPGETRIVKGSKLLLALCEEIVNWQSQNFLVPERLKLIEVFFDQLRVCNAAPYLHIPLPERSSLRLVAQRVVEDPGDSRSVDYWSRQARMSRRSFTKYFSKETGLSFVVWRQRVKMQYALKILNENCTVKEAAAQVNYSTSTFILLFHRYYGRPPRQFISKMSGA